MVVKVVSSRNGLPCTHDIRSLETLFCLSVSSVFVARLSSRMQNAPLGQRRCVEGLSTGERAARL
jgi:hypothetical protein